MTENQQHQSIYNINQQKQPEKREKPQLLKKPIPKPRRRITIGSGDSNKLNNEENNKLINKSFLNLNIKEEEKNIFKNNFNEKEQQNNNILINSLTTSKRIKTFGGNINNSPPYAPQLPRKILKSGSTPILQPKNQQKIFNQNLNEKHLKINNKLIEEFNKNKNKEKQINLQKQQFGELKRLKIPPPLKNQQQILNNKIIEKRSKTPIRRENEGKKVTSSSSPLFLHCPRASPEATGSSLNSPTSPPPLSTNFVNNWQNVEEGEQNEDLLLKELAAEGDPECLLIASWLESSTCVNNGGGEQLDGINDGLDINENQRPRFSLDRLVPPELQLEIAKPIENNEQQICGEFSLQKSSPRGQCQGTVFIHFHQEKNNFDIKIEKEEEQKRIINLNKKKRPLSINNNNNFIKVDGTVEQRKQQNEVPYHHKQIEKEKEENKSKLINQNNNKISPYSTSPSLRSGVTLLEQLVKSHPIWFLPHLDRQAASHLLRHQEPGVFIVRGSSRIINNSFTNSEVSASFHSSNQRSSVSVMALSVRLPPPKEEENEEIYEEKIDTDQLDHFLLEAVGSGQSVRLQGSPRTFTSLPLLLEHYCQPEAIQELKCSLCLPNSVAKCESIHSLQGLALLGQDFWTSPLAFQNNSTQIQLPSSTNDYSSSSCTRSQCHSPASSSLRSGPLPTLPPIQQQPPKMGTFITQQTHHQNISNHHFFYCESPCPSTTSTAVSAPPTSLIGGEPSSFYGYHHHQRANNNCCCCCCAANGCPGHQQQIMIQQQRQFAALPLRKSRSVQSSFISGTPPQPHYSSHKSTAASFCLSPSTQSLRESNYGQRFMVPPPLKKRGPESFLRALFSPSPQRRRQKGNESSWEWMPSSSPLWEEEQPTNTTNSGNKAIINNAQQQTLKPTTNTHLKQQQRQQPGSSIFARLKGNFRRTSSSGISSPSSKDDWQGRNQVSTELLNARQAAFRRTNTDLGVPTNSGTNRMALALNKMRKQQKPPNPSLPPQSFPQLARVLPQPRTTANFSGAKHSYIINGSSNFNNNNKNNNNNFFITPFAAPPSDIRKQQQNNLIKQTKVYLPTPPLRQRQNNLNNFIEKKNFDGGGFNNNNLNNSSSNKFSTKSQAVIATVHPQPKMVLNSCKKLQTNLDTKEIDDEEENNKLNNSSEYTHLNELFKGEPSTSGEENIVNFRDSFKNGGDEVSVAGTDFNEPWDSNAWENLLEIAKFGDAKTEVPLLSERPRRRRSSCDTSSISSNGSTWRRSSSDDNDEYLNKNKTTKENVKNEKIKQKEKCSDEEKENNTDDDINVAEEAVAMAVVLAGNGTLPNRKKPRPMEWLCEELLENENEEEEEENKINIISNESNQILPQNASLDTLILIEQAAKAANSSRCNMSQRVRWTRNSREASTSLMDIPSSSCAQIEQQNIPQKDDKFDSMEEFNGESGGHRRSERRLRAMMERSIGEHQTQNIHQTAFPSVNAYSTSMDELGSQHSRTGSICPSITPVLSPSRLRNASQESQGEKDPALVIQQYVETLSTDDSTVFGATLQRFVECTLLSREQDPYVVVRRVRQFLNGIKNYLVKNGEADLHLVIERESDRLHADEFLNIDAILESVLNKILLVRIKAQLYRLMIMENTRNGELGKLTENLSLVRAMNAEELGFPEDTVLPDKIRMESINKQLRKMQNHYSPLKKLQLLLRALALAVPHLPLLSSSELQRQQQQQSFVATQPSNSSVFLSPIAQTSNSIGAIGGRLRTNSGSSSGGAMAAALKHPPADELIRWLVYLLARSSTINCEIEAWYMWELLPQQVLSTGDASYFLSILFSAVHVIKHPEIVKRLKNISLMPGRHPLPNIADFLGSQSTLQDVDDFANNNSDLLLRVAIPNEQEGSIEYHTFPVLPKMNASKLCRVIAHQFSVSNPEDYGLYVLFDGYETVLSPDEFPHLVRDNMIQSGKGHLFAYKRSETRIAWPKQAFSNFGTTTTIHTEKKILVEPPKSVNVHQQSSSSSSRLTTSSNGKGRIKAVASNSNNRLTNKNNMLFNIGMHA